MFKEIQISVTLYNCESHHGTLQEGLLLECSWDLNLAGKWFRNTLSTPLASTLGYIFLRV